VVVRNTLPPPAQDKFRQMLRGIERVSQLIAVDRSSIQAHLAGAGGGGGEEEEEAREMLAVWREVNRVRANFWGLTIPTPIRSLWLLVRNAFLSLEDLRLGYAVCWRMLAYADVC
jgi:hypothetical protein